jgi:hypothetical protein
MQELDVCGPAVLIVVNGELVSCVFADVLGMEVLQVVSWREWPATPEHLPH